MNGSANETSPSERQSFIFVGEMKGAGMGLEEIIKMTS